MGKETRWGIDEGIKGGVLVNSNHKRIIRMKWINEMNEKEREMGFMCY